jgi:hypothetical protein
MGYRSNVKAVFVFGTEEARVVFFVRAKMIEDDLVQSMLTLHKVAQNSERFLIQIALDDWKWYDDCQAAFTTLSDLVDECKGAWALAQIGENFDDVSIESGGEREDQYWPTDFVTIRREVVFEELT